MNNSDVFKLMAEALPDLSASEIRIIQGFSLKQRERYQDRPGMANLFAAIYCLLQYETWRRRDVLKGAGANITGLSVDWPESNK